MCRAATAIITLSFVLAFAGTARAQRQAAVTRVDVDGDGLADVVTADDTEVFVFLGARGGPVSTPSQRIPIPTLPGCVSCGLAYPEVVGVGDVDGDGRTDVMVRDALYLGGPHGLGSAPAARIGNPAGEVDGVRFVAAGDVNGDGRDDVLQVVACAPMVLESYPPIVVECVSDHDELLLHLGTSNGLSEAPAARVAEPRGGCDPAPVAGVGDLNGDGFEDVVRARGADLVLHLGGRQGLDLAGGEVVEGLGRVARIAWLAGAGDVDADGFSDLLVTVWRDADRSSLLLLTGSPTGPTARGARPLIGTSAYSHEPVGLGDVDGDGYSDFGEMAWARRGLGRVVVLWRGGPRGPRPRVEIRGSGTTGDLDALSGPGDVDGDGEVDVVVGSSQVDHESGAIYVFSGRSPAPGRAPTATLSSPPGERRAFGSSLARPAAR